MADLSLPILTDLDKAPFSVDKASAPGWSIIFWSLFMTPSAALLHETTDTFTKFQGPKQIAQYLQHLFRAVTGYINYVTAVLRPQLLSYVFMHSLCRYVGANECNVATSNQNTDTSTGLNHSHKTLNTNQMSWQACCWPIKNMNYLRKFELTPLNGYDVTDRRARWSYWHIYQL